MTSIFKITASQLSDLFNREVDSANRLSLLISTHKGAAGILQKLQSQADVSSFFLFITSHLNFVFCVFV